MKIFALFLALAAGCGEDVNTNNNDLAMRMNDLSGPRDMSAAPCLMIGAWPGLQAEGFFEADFLGAGPATVALSRQSGGTPWNELSIEAWHTEVYPNTVTFAEGDTYSECDTCVLFGEDCDDQGCTTIYFAQGGTGTITQADKAGTGRMRASAATLKLVEWDFQADEAIPGGKCVEVGSASWDVSFVGADGGTNG